MLSWAFRKQGFDSGFQLRALDIFKRRFMWFWMVSKGAYTVLGWV